MFVQVTVLSILLVALQEVSPPTVRRVFVTTPHNASIIFEYANAAIPEGEPIKPGAVECLTSQLLTTGLFSTAEITLKPTNIGNKVDVDISPRWVENRNAIVVREISMEGFTAINEDQLREGLRRRGLQANVPLLRYPLPAIRNMIFDSIRETYRGDFSTMKDVEETLSDISFRIEPVASQAVRLTIIVGKRRLCE